MKYGIVCAALVSVACLFGHTTSSVANDYSYLTQHPTIQRLVQLTNAHRSRMGRAPLALNPVMCAHAQQHANYMATTGVFAHSGLPYMEVIFQGVTSADAAVQGWIYSPAHHSILLSGSECGFGYMVSGGRYCWVGVVR